MVEAKPGKKPSRQRTSGTPMTVTKRVRMSEDEAERLREIAQRDGKTESEVLREGILAYDRHQTRRQAVEALVAMAERDKVRGWSKASGFR